MSDGEALVTSLIDPFSFESRFLSSLEEMVWLSTLRVRGGCDEVCAQKCWLLPEVNTCPSSPAALHRAPASSCLELHKREQHAINTCAAISTPRYGLGAPAQANL